MKPLKVMIETPTSAKISPLGKPLEVDIKPLLEALEKAGGKGETGTLKELTGESLQSSFVALPEEPVKVGDTYEAGKIAWKIPGHGECADQDALRSCGGFRR